MGGHDRASQKMTILDWIKFIFLTGIPGIPAFISNRPSVVDARLASVCRYDLAIHATAALTKYDDSSLPC